MNTTHEDTKHEDTKHESTSTEQKLYTEEERIAAIRETKRKERNRFAWAIALLS